MVRRSQDSGFDASHRPGMTTQRSSRDDTALNIARPASRQELPLDLGGGKRPAEQESLHLRASFGSDAVELLGGFHALGGGRHAHAVGECGNRAYDVERARIL